MTDADAFGAVFLLEGGLFLIAAVMALQIIQGREVPDAEFFPGE